MSLIQILALIFTCLVFRLFIEKKLVDSVLLATCVIFMYWFQPVSTIRTLDYWLPALSILVGIISWIIITKESEKNEKENAKTGLLVFSILFILGLMRFIPFLNIQKMISIPNIEIISIFILVSSLVLIIINLVNNKIILIWSCIAFLVFIFILIKNQYLALKTSEILRKINGQSINLANSNEIIWVGYSYFSFRMIHALIESKKRSVYDISLKTYLLYLFYFPAFLAGPIQKINEFKNEISGKKIALSKDLLHAGKRIATGIFQKFIIADTFAIISIDEHLSKSINSNFWMWIVVIAFSLRIYFDFNGYTHIALGLSRIIGINLPENFNKPLSAPTIAIFWNRWHITLTQWFRVYFFNPFSRFLKINYKNINQNLLMGVMQISTMTLIGLWHGININFIVWGLWNGLGLFVNNRISTVLVKKINSGKYFWQISKMTQAISIGITFIFISLGWVWFALPNLNSSIRAFMVLFGKL